MRIELRQNRIVIVLTEAESDFLGNQAAAAGQKDIISYIKAKLLKALDLKAFEDSAIVNLGNNFNLEKIKHISTELSQRKIASGTYLPDESASDSSDEEDLIDDLLEEELLAKEQDFNPTRVDEDIIDDLLSDLLDKDLLEGRLADPTKPDVGARLAEPGTKKRPSGNPKAPKSRKHSPKPEKTED